MARESGPNWLLRTLVILSVGVHAILLAQLAGVYRSGILSYIEISMESIAKPSARSIPRPRARIKPPPPRDRVKVIQAARRPVQPVRPLAMAPMESDLPDTLMEGIGMPDIPRVPAVDAGNWAADAPVHEPVGEFMTPGSYLDMVRLKIESRKRYPESAKARSIEGRVTIHFILATDGSVRDVSVLKGTHSQALNSAALDAVRRAAPFPRPPANLFPSDLSLKLIIVFELT